MRSEMNSENVRQMPVQARKGKKNNDKSYDKSV